VIDKKVDNRDRTAYPGLTYYEIITQVVSEECSTIGALEGVFEALDRLEDAMEEE
jgi:hypothetical protein